MVRNGALRAAFGLIAWVELACGMMGASAAYGATFTASSGGGNWNTAASWLNNSGSPGPNDTILFPATYKTNINPTANSPVYGVTFIGSTLAAWNSGMQGGTVTLGAGGITATSIASSTTSDLNIESIQWNTTTVLSANQTWSIGAGTATNVTGNYQYYQKLVPFQNVNLNGTTLVLTGGGELQNRSTGFGTSGGGGVVINGNSLFASDKQSSDSNGNASTLGNIPFTINAGRLQLQYETQAGGALGSNGVTLNAGGSFVNQNNYDATAASGLNTSTPFTLSGGDFRPFWGGAALTSAVTQNVGAITLGGGQTTYWIYPGAVATAAQATLQSSNFTRTAAAHGTVQFEGYGANMAIANAGGTGVGRILLVPSTSASLITSQLIGGGGTTATATNTSILPWGYSDITAVTAANYANYGSTFVTYSGTAGVQTLNPAVNYDAALGTAADNVRIVGNANNTFTGPQTANSLLIDINGTQGNYTLTGDGTSPLAITSGALMFGGSRTTSASSQTSTESINSVGKLVFGSTTTPIEAFITVSAVNTNTTGIGGIATYQPGILTINAPITANNLTKSGPGTLIIAGAQTYSGVTTINNGNIQLAAGAQLPSGTTLNIYGATIGFGPNGWATNIAANNGQAAAAQNGVFDLNGNNQTLAGLNGATGAGGGAYGIVTNSNATAATLTLTSGGTAGALQGNLSLNLSDRRGHPDPGRQQHLYGQRHDQRRRHPANRLRHPGHRLDPRGQRLLHHFHDRDFGSLTLAPAVQQQHRQDHHRARAASP